MDRKSNFGKSDFANKVHILAVSPSSSAKFGIGVAFLDFVELLSPFFSITVITRSDFISEKIKEMSKRNYVMRRNVEVFKSKGGIYEFSLFYNVLKNLFLSGKHIFIISFVKWAIPTLFISKSLLEFSFNSKLFMKSEKREKGNEKRKDKSEETQKKGLRFFFKHNLEKVDTEAINSRVGDVGLKQEKKVMIFLYLHSPLAKKEGFIYSLKNFFLKLTCFDLVSGVITVSDFMRKRILELFGVQSYVIPNRVDFPYVLKDDLIGTKDVKAQEVSKKYSDLNSPDIEIRKSPVQLSLFPEFKEFKLRFSDSEGVSGAGFHTKYINESQKSDSSAEKEKEIQVNINKKIGSEENKDKIGDDIRSEISGGSGGKSSGKLKVAFFGNPIKRKHPEIFFEIVKVLGDEFEYVFVGGDSKNFQIPYEVKSKVRFFDFLPRDKALQIMREVDFVVAPYEDEPFGLVVSEAMALGKVVIGLNSGALPELIKDGVTGFLVDELSPFKFAEKIKLAITCRNEIGSNASEFIRKNFSSHAVRKKWFDFFRVNLS